MSNRQLEIAALKYADKVRQKIECGDMYAIREAIAKAWMSGWRSRKARKPAHEPQEDGE